jgi:hypothetical protein
MDSGVLDRVETKLDNIAVVMAEVREQVKLTNGRVTKIEIWQGGHEVWTEAKHAQMQAAEARLKSVELALYSIDNRLSEAKGMARAWVGLAAIAASGATATLGAILQHYIK